MRIVNETPLATGAIAVRSGADAAGFTLIVKGTFKLAPGEAAAAASEQQPLTGDQFSGEGTERICRYEDDFAPFKPRADLLLVGHVGRGESASGTCRVGGQGAALASFGPVNRHAGARAELAGAEAGDWFEFHWPRLADDCPWDYFNAAPEEMRVEGYLEGGEEVVLENLHPRHDSFRARLPGLKVRCFLKPEGGSAAEVPMNLDTAWIDVSSDTLVLVWRGQAEADPNLEPDLLVVSENLAGTPKPATEYQARLDAETPAEEKAESEKAEHMLSAAGGAPEGLPPEIKLALDDPEAGMPKLAEQANLDDPRFDAMPAGDEPPTSSAALDGVSAAGGEPDAAAPDALKAAVEPPADESANPLASAGMDAGLVDAVVAPEGPGDAKEAAAPAMALAGLSLDDLPADLLAALDNPAAAAAASAILERIEPGMPPTLELPGEKAEQAIAAGEVPDWPEQSAAEAETIAVLTAAYGADRPPHADGAMFLALLAHVAGEDMGLETDDAQSDEPSQS